MGAIYVRDTSADEARAYDEHWQRDVWEARESELAFFAGKQARRDHQTAGMNPYRSEHEVKAWARGWTQVDGEAAAQVLARRAA